MDTTPRCSRVVPRLSTERAQRMLTSEFRWDLVHYGRIVGAKHGYISHFHSQREIGCLCFLCGTLGILADQLLTDAWDPS